MQAAGASKAAANADEEELTSEAASKLLHVSRTHVNTLADSGALGVVRRTDGGHRRISKAALLKYKALSKERQSKGLDAMVAASQKLGLYDAELEGLPVKAGR
jgi:excisionase family DNA binding protein